MKEKRGFTLIELLVVIAIIAILAAILFPVFARARAQARKASCTSNVRQLTLGMNMYAQDYDETYPQWQWDRHFVGASGANTFPNNATTVWWNAIYPYVRNHQIFTCPDTNYRFTTRQDGHWGWFQFQTAQQIAASGINPILLDVSISYGSNEPLTYSYPKISSLQVPAETLLVSDMATSLTGWECWNCFDWNNPANPANRYRLRRVAYANGAGRAYFWTDAAWMGPFDPAWEDDARHLRQQVIGYADGHTKVRMSSQTTVDLFGRF